LYAGQSFLRLNPIKLEDIGQFRSIVAAGLVLDRVSRS